MLDRDDEKYCFMLHRDRVFYSRLVINASQSNACRISLARHAETIKKKHIISFGTCIGRFSKSGQFKIHITALDYLSPYAQYRVWLKPPAEQQFLYGQHVHKSGLARISEDTPQYAGVVVMNMNDVPIVSHSHISRDFFLRDLESLQSQHYSQRIRIQ